MTEFKQLQDIWYKKLADSGFVDIESTLSNKNWVRPGPLHFTEMTPEKSNYFSGIKLAIDEMYRSLHPRLLTHKQRIMLYVLERHADGASTRRICHELQLSGLSPNRRNTINAWIKQFVHVCGLRYYSQEEMRNL